MKELEKYITDERTGLKYELIGDYYFLAGDDEPEEHRPIGIWGCGCPVDTSAEGGSADRAGRRDRRHEQYPQPSGGDRSERAHIHTSSLKRRGCRKIQ